VAAPTIEVSQVLINAAGATLISDRPQLTRTARTASNASRDRHSAVRQEIADSVEPASGPRAPTRPIPAVMAPVRGCSGEPDGEDDEAAACGLRCPSGEQHGQRGGEDHEQNAEQDRDAAMQTRRETREDHPHIKQMSAFVAANCRVAGWAGHRSDDRLIRNALDLGVESDLLSTSR
jgi:hypothetical protein